jgi:hypothetical protein
MKRHQARKGNGRFIKNTIENTFGLHCIFCPNCGIGNPYGLAEERPSKCHSCEKDLISEIKKG